MQNTTHQPPDAMLMHVMLTVAAIIQGVAFTELVQSCEFKMLHIGMRVGIENWLNTFEVSAVFSVVVVVWFGQVVNTVGFALWPRGYFGFVDALFPFAFGTVEVKLAQLIGQPTAQCWWLFVFYAVISVAWFDFHRKLDQRIASNNEWFGDRYARFKHRNLWSSGLLAGVFWGLSWYGFGPVASRFLLAGTVIGLGVATGLNLWQTWEVLKRAPAVPHHLVGTPASDLPSDNSRQHTTPRTTNKTTFVAVAIGLMIGTWLTSRVTQRAPHQPRSDGTKSEN